MSLTLLLVQTLNGLQLGVLLFLIAAGLTLVFGVMDFINLAHGVQYMLGAYLAVMFYGVTGNFLFALILALAAALVFGLVLEFAVFRHLYDRDHLDQVIATFGIILFLNQGVKILWGASPLSLPVPEMFSGSIVLMPGILYPVWRLVIIGSGLAVAALLYVLVSHTRIGMLVRAGATNAAMVSALGVDIRRLFLIVFGFGAMLAGFAGIMIAPILSVDPGMGDTILILAFVVIVIGGIGSIRGAFLAALLIGLVDTLGRSFSVDILRLVMGPSPARTVGPALASMLIYLLMAVVLYVRPSGLFPAKGREDGGRGPRHRCHAGKARPLRRQRAADRDVCDLRAGAARRDTDRRGLCAQPRLARDGLCHRGARTRPAGRLRRAGLVRARGLHRARRIHGRHPRRTRHSRRADLAPRRARRIGAVRARDRRRLPAHQGRLLHHDHARLRADGLFHRELARALRRRRRPHHPDALDLRGLADPRERSRALLRLPSCAARRVSPVPLAHCLALRARLSRRARECAPLGYDRIRCLSFSARRVRDRRDARRPLRLPARQRGRLRQPRLHVVAALGRIAHHGDPRRHGHAQRRDHRRGGVPADRGMAVGHHRALEGDLRAAACGRGRVRARRSDRGRTPAMGAVPWLSRCCASKISQRISAACASPTM